MRRRWPWFVVTAIVGAGVYARTLLATPASMFMTTQMVNATFDELNLNVDVVADSGGGSGCTTVQPVSSWVCVNGGWLRADHQLARGGGV